MEPGLRALELWLHAKTAYHRNEIDESNLISIHFLGIPFA